LVVEQLRNIVTKTVDLVLPPRCAICGATGAFLCGHCSGGLRELIEPPVTISRTTGSTLEIHKVAGVVEASARSTIARKQVLLVDDVMTTEATLRSAGKAINDLGAHHALAVTLTGEL
jgi:hypothetical protein